ncbi:MAG TPA: 16S rRNA (adenine(1518)-N(6)/adenine(1519)-N(6))-dimethyltransferase RsmA [Planctomycetota bacterium]|jgi:16S rRNA (adenine1518-N6/adenine1519-N6)-dimethyltransferase|nr:16S rRNA (adenine(1518)-N(6)/adenine(1519)-N(6))-dimethyltransferase RsmA [Planctomycetota bacterium]
MSGGGAAGLREALERHGFRPSRYRGQCFLVDENLADAIVRDAGLAPGESVLEVGCGPGGLTSRLAAGSRRVLAVEIEPALAAACAEALGRAPGVEILRTDVLAGKRRLAPEVEERLSGIRPYVLVSNLPYAVAGPVLVELASARVPPERMVAMVQEEVALRVAAPPGSRAYGPLSASLGIGWSAEVLRRVPPEVFWPRPRVRSAVVRLLPLASRPDPAAYRLELVGVHLLFRWPRKTLRAVLRQAGAADPSGLLATLRLDPGLRVGELERADLRRLSHALAEEKPADPLYPGARPDRRSP